MRVHVVVPEGFDNPGQPTGGNIYDRRICAGLAEAGWDVLVTTIATAWPVPGPGARADLARIVSVIPDGETVLIDGLIASPAAAQLLPHTGRIRMTVLLHMPLATVLDTHHDASAQRSERIVLRAATGVVVTSEWTRQRVLTRYAIPAHRVHVARPGVDQVAAPARPVRGHLISVEVLGRHKGQELLVEALANLAERDWHCLLAGPLARGLPVIAAAVGGLPEALGSTADGTRPANWSLPAIRLPSPARSETGWVTSATDTGYGAAARQRRSTLRGWEQATQEIANAWTAHGCRKPVPPGVDNHPEKTSGPA